MVFLLCCLFSTCNTFKADERELEMKQLAMMNDSLRDEIHTLRSELVSSLFIHYRSYEIHFLSNFSNLFYQSYYC